MRRRVSFKDHDMTMLLSSFREEKLFQQAEPIYIPNNRSTLRFKLQVILFLSIVSFVFTYAHCRHQSKTRFVVPMRILNSKRQFLNKDSEVFGEIICFSRTLLCQG